MATKTRKAPAKKAPTEASVLKQVSALLDLSDMTRLKLAMLLVASDAATTSVAFADSIRDAYEALPATQRRASGARNIPTVLTLDVHPIKEVRGFTLNLGEPLNPYLVFEAYGERQMRQILDVFSSTALKESARLVEERNPGTKLRGRPTKPALIDYIVAYVTRSA